MVAYCGVLSICWYNLTMGILIIIRYFFVIYVGIATRVGKVHRKLTHTSACLGIQYSYNRAQTNLLNGLRLVLRR